MEWIRGGPHKVDAANITAAIDSSLQRLGTDYIDIVSIHWPDRYLQDMQRMQPLFM
jgi:aryl-alcohol dehydrogenase-like predicted oxidoreductase